MGFQFAGIVPGIRFARVTFNVFVFESDRREKCTYFEVQTLAASVCGRMCLHCCCRSLTHFFLIREHFAARSFMSPPNRFLHTKYMFWLFKTVERHYIERFV